MQADPTRHFVGRASERPEYVACPLQNVAELERFRLCRHPENVEAGSPYHLREALPSEVMKVHTHEPRPAASHDARHEPAHVHGRKREKPARFQETVYAFQAVERILNVLPHIPRGHDVEAFALCFKLVEHAVENREARGRCLRRGPARRLDPRRLPSALRRFVEKQTDRASNL